MEEGSHGAYLPYMGFDRLWCDCISEWRSCSAIRMTRLNLSCRGGMDMARWPIMLRHGH
jgi:hypothetical protein